MNDQLAFEQPLFAGCGRIADKDEVRFVSGGRQGLGKARNARGQAADTCVSIGAFKRNEHEHEVIRARRTVWV